MPQDTLGNWTTVAQSYAALGWHLIPFHGRVEGACTCGNATCTGPPHPWYSPGPETATCEVHQIEQWGPETPDGQPVGHVGLFLGRASGIVALEVSRREDGHQALRRLENRHHRLPSTPTFFVDGHRQIRLFRHPETEHGVPPETHLEAGLRLYGDGHVKRLPDRIEPVKRSFRRWVISPAGRALAPVPAWMWKAANLEWIGEDITPRTVCTSTSMSDASTVPEEPRPDAEATPPPFTTAPETLPFQTYTAKQITRLAARPWILRPWLAQGTVTVLAGPAKTAGKTTFLLHMIAAIRRGTPFLGAPSTPTGIALLSAQSPAALANAALDAGLRDDDLLSELHVLYTDQLCPAQDLNLVQRIATFCSIREADLLVIDAFGPLQAAYRAAAATPHSALSMLASDLATAAGRRLAVCITLPMEQNAHVHHVLDRLGPLNAITDTVLYLSPYSRTDDVAPPRAGARKPSNRSVFTLPLPPARRIEAVSRFAEVPATLTIVLDDGAFRVVPGEDSASQTTPRREAAEGPSPVPPDFSGRLRNVSTPKQLRTRAQIPKSLH